MPTKSETSRDEFKLLSRKGRESGGSAQNLQTTPPPSPPQRAPSCAFTDRRSFQTLEAGKDKRPEGLQRRLPPSRRGEPARLSFPRPLAARLHLGGIVAFGAALSLPSSAGRHRNRGSNRPVVPGAGRLAREPAFHPIGVASFSRSLVQAWGSSLSHHTSSLGPKHSGPMRQAESMGRALNIGPPTWPLE